MLHIAGGEGGEHEGIVELTLGEGGQLVEAGFVSHLKTGAGVGIGRKAFGALQDLRATGAEGGQALLAQAGEGEVGLEGGVEQLPLLIVSGVVGVLAGQEGAQFRVVEQRLAVGTHHVVHLLGSLHGTENGRLEQRVLTHDGAIIAELREQFGGGAVLEVALQLDAVLLGVEGCPVVEGHAVGVVGREDTAHRGAEVVDKVLVLEVAVLALGGETAHEQAGEVDVGLGKRPEEGRLVGLESAGGDGIAADDVLAGGGGHDEGFLRLHAGGGKLRHALVGKGSDDGDDGAVARQRFAQGGEVGRELVVPPDLQVDGQRVVHLRLAEVLEEPVGGALQAGFRGSVADGCHHGHGLLHPMAGRNYLRAVVLLLAGSEK